MHHHLAHTDLTIRNLTLLRDFVSAYSSKHISASTILAMADQDYVRDCVAPILLLNTDHDPERRGSCRYGQYSCMGQGCG